MICPKFDMFRSNVHVVFSLMNILLLSEHLTGINTEHADMRTDCEAMDYVATKWIDGQAGSTIVVEITNKNMSLCNSLKSCYNSTERTNASELLLQLHPVTLQLGQMLGFQLSDDCLNCSVRVLKVNASQFRDCNNLTRSDTPETNFNKGKSHPDNQTKTADEYDTFRHSQALDHSTEFTLQKGLHYFIVEDLGSSEDPDSGVFGCWNGFRVNVSVKEESCRSTENDSLCSGHGVCITSIHQPAYFCRCCHGYIGRFCESTCETNNCSTSCFHDNCKNGGTCISDHNFMDSPGYRCICPRSATGVHCEHELTGCQSSPCVHGICVDRQTNYQCYCIPGFHGKQCEQEYNECISNPCQHHGTCIDRVDRYQCMCTKGYSGINCQEKVDLCKTFPCYNNATCTDRGDTVHCSCPHGITGRRCEHHIRQCESAPCQNQGTCINVGNTFECRCPITFAGVHCEYMMDVFAPALDRTSLDGESHVHNLYIVAGTLCGAICLMAIVLLGCYCKMHETYRQLSWRRIRYKRRSLSCSDLERYGKTKTFSRSRLSVDAILEGTSLCYDNTSLETPLKQSLQAQQV